MTIRTGKQYLEGLAAHPREVWTQGRRIIDVAADPVFRGPVQTLATLYDLQHAPQHRDVMTCLCPDSGKRMGFSYLRPTTPEHLLQRRQGSRIWAEASFGMLGRSPDFLNTTVMTFADNAEFFSQQGPQFGDNIRAFYAHCRDNDVFMTHALIPPQNDRSKASSEQEDPFMHLGVVRQVEEGLVVRGAKMLATHAPIADELMVYPSGVLKPGDERYALAFAIPSDAPGIRYICREPFDAGTQDAWNHPLSTRFEEPDAVVVFDDVLIPWHRVFLHGDIKLANAMPAATNQRHFTGHQTAVRGLAKTRFMTGLAIALTRSVKSDVFLHVQEQLGECLGYLSLIEGAILLAERNAEPTDTGTLRPAAEPLQAIRYHLPKMYERMVQVTQVLGAGGLLLNPTEADLDSEIGPDIDRYYRGAGIDARTRIRISKLAWDATGTQFGQRMVQYERYYGGDPVRVGAGNYLAFPADELLAYVESALAGER
jgi:4-hydroxyphenylacetate 3-monooxygenase oxygenase component